MGARIVAAVLLLGIPLVTHAAELVDRPRWGVHLGLEDFSWSEEDAAGDEILTEDGARLTGAVTFDNLLRGSEGPIYALEVRGYWGEVGHDGETIENKVPLTTDVEYTGTRGEARLGYRFGPYWGGYGLDGLVALGGEYWLRDIKDSYTDGGSPVAGYTEKYMLPYAKVGVGVADLTYKEWFGRLEVGAQYPLQVDEAIDDLDLELHPDPQPSLYAAYEITKAIQNGRQLGLTVYYDSYRFDPSPAKDSGDSRYYQPKSDMDVIGLRIGYFWQAL